jgi:ATPase subunit of ABC transporter with duplicated ATPase domains
VTQGERIGLIGRNGAGKSTVFKLIMGKEEPTSGKDTELTKLGFNETSRHQPIDEISGG